MRLRAATATALVGLVSLIHAAPRVLVVQRAILTEGVENVPVSQKFVAELDNDGRVAPIQWSMTDPVVRDAIEKRVLTEFTTDPDDKTLRDIARKLDVEYVLVVSVTSKGDSVFPRATLFDPSLRRRIWTLEDDKKIGEQPKPVVTKDGKVDKEETQALREKYAESLKNGMPSATVVMVNGEVDMNATVATMARTWNAMLAEGPFKKYEPRKKTISPEPGPAQTFTGGAGVGADANTSVEEALEQAKELDRIGQPDRALLVLRKCIDTAPLDPQPRTMEVDLLLKQGQYALAAEKAMVALHMSEDKSELWIKAADAYVRLGDLDRALDCANQGVARGNMGFLAMQVMAEVWMFRGDSEKSLGYYDQAIAKEQSPRAYAGRALARALSGDVEGCVRDVEAAQASGPIAPDVYQRTMETVGLAIPQFAEALRQVPRLARTNKSEPTLRLAERTNSQLSAVVELLVRIRPPQAHKLSHQTRDLAYKLLKQSSVEALAFVKNGTEDSAMESAISLGEALKLAPTIEEQYRIEKKYPQGLKTD